MINPAIETLDPGQQMAQQGEMVQAVLSLFITAISPSGILEIILKETAS